MAIFKLTKDALVPLAGTQLSTEGILERKDLQHLLRSQIQVLDPDLMVISEEFAEWIESSRRIDLLCIDREANLVVIELKRSEDGGSFPFHRQAADRHELVGFKFKCKVVFPSAEETSIYGTVEKSATWQGEITLLSEDMRRIGCALAREFCSVVSGDQAYFEREAKAVTEPLRAA